MRVLGAGRVEQRSNGGGWAQFVSRGRSNNREASRVYEAARGIEGRAVLVHLFLEDQTGFTRSFIISRTENVTLGAVVNVLEEYGIYSEDHVCVRMY